MIGLRGAPMDVLEDYGHALGLSPEGIEIALSHGQGRAGDGWIGPSTSKGGKDRAGLITLLLQSGTGVEYKCRDYRGRFQGTALIKIRNAMVANGSFEATHVLATDEYYQHYMSELEAGRGYAFHFCLGRPGKCKTKLETSDKRELIHVGEFRLTPPALMVQEAHLRETGIRWGRDALKEAAEAAKAVESKKVRTGTGLEEQMEEVKRKRAEEKLKVPEEPAEVEKKEPAKSAKAGEDEKKRGRTSLAEHLAERGRRHSREHEVRRDERWTKKRKSSSLRRRKDKRKKYGDSSSESGTHGSSSSSQSFQKSPARGGASLMRLSEKKPGRLAEISLKEMTRFLSDRDENGERGAGWSGQRVTAYLNQIVFNQNPASKIGIRSTRELMTLALVIDEILEGNQLRALDVLLQRFKAVEASFLEGGWAVAKHLELIPATTASMTREDERELAAKSELRALKLRESLQKASKPK